MALRQPPQQQRRPTQRPSSVPQSVQVDATHDVEEEAQEWILFSPAAIEDESSLKWYKSQTGGTQSRFSDIGSLETGVRSDQQHDIDNDDVTCQGTDIDDDEAEELDSLDDGLHAFHAPLSLDQSAAVFPAHDGMGTFPDGVQEQLWQFERYNPNRRRPQRRRSSVQKCLDEALDLHEVDKHEERRLRIESWRLEQSRAVLDEVEKEAKRRKRRLSIVTAKTEEETETESESESESFWQQITRRVIKDLMGLDDSTLCVIFGEDLAPDAATTPTQQSPISSTLSTHHQTNWEHRLLSRIARELGFLAHKLAEHDGAFSTYAHQPPSDSIQYPSPSKPRHIPAPAPSLAPSNDSTAPLFAPTFPNAPPSPTAEVDTSLWGIQEEPQTTTQHAQTSKPDNHQEPNYWEKELDIGVVFSYLRSRFSSRPPSPTPQAAASKSTPQLGVLPVDWASPPAPTASALGTSPESRRRADLIRRHHPLVSHAASVSASRRRESVLLRSLHRRTASSSCASQSTKRTRSGGSRRYWDFPSGASSAVGGSVVSLGSTGVEGVMGNWGEV